jgi:hypothetical protein
MMTIQHCWWQILVAAIVYFALGAVWFNPKVFGTAWANSHGIKMNDEDKKKVNMGKLFTLSFLCGLVLCAAVCIVCCAACGSMCTTDGQCVSAGIGCCLKSGLLVGLSASAAISMAYIYQMKPIAAYYTDCGYHIIGCLLAAITLHLLGCC